MNGTGRGCVLVSSVVAGGNADKSGKVLVGDMVCYLGKASSRFLCMHALPSVRLSPLLLHTWLIPITHQHTHIQEPTGMVRVEGYDYDGVMAGLQGYMSTGASSITLVLKRLVKRQTLTVKSNRVGLPCSFDD